MDEIQDTTQKRVLIGVGVAVAAVAVLLGALVLAGGDDDDDGATSASSSTTLSTTTTSTAPSTTTTTAPAAPAITPADLDAALFPDLSGDDRYDDPVDLARAFATETLGFRDDVAVGAFAAGDAQSGEVEVSAIETVPTTVLVRKVGDGSWAVIGAVTESIELATPANGSPIRSVQPVLGRAYAFEGQVDVALYADGSEDPIAQTFVTGRGDGVLGPFEGDLEFQVPNGATRGLLVLTSASGEDGSTMAATAIRVRF
ncbi:MAG: Gmad2 immunoglobulin-like domain-containing protein [Acidimicrobiales bacterium]|nr:Gmad2 immunoglobulin-like domain-containing protein [Acidimicrobiales bacterium]